LGVPQDNENPTDTEAEDEDFVPVETNARLDADAQQEVRNAIETPVAKSIAAKIAEAKENGTPSILQVMQADAPPEEDLDHRFWQYHVIIDLLRNYERPLLVNSHARLLSQPEATLAAEDALWRRSFIGNTIPEGDGPRLPFELASDDDAAISRDNQQILDNPRFQPQGHVQACKELDIANPERPRLPGMPLHFTFKPWQPVVIKWVLEKQGLGLGGEMIADKMGLGKTIMALGAILAVSLHPTTDICWQYICQSNVE
jgi:hypothetical protein